MLKPLGVLAIVAMTPVVFAQTSAKKQAPTSMAPSASVSAAPVFKGPAMVRLATEIASGIGTIPPGTLIAVSPLVSDIPAPKADELANRIGAQLGGRLTAKVHPQPVALSVARAASGRAGSLVYVQLEIAKGVLRATADLYPAIPNGWERLRNPVPGPQAHAFSEVPLDAEVRTFLQPIVLEQAKVSRAKHDEGDVIAVGCGDLDADGGLELVLASKQRISVGKIRAGKFDVTASAPWKEIAYAAPVPLREPLGTMTVTYNEILVGITDRYAIALDATLTPRRTLSGPPIPGADACVLASPENDAFEGNGVACPLPAKGAKPVETLPLPTTHFDAVAALALGNAQILATREPGGKLKLRRTEGAAKPLEISIEQTGAQMALADLDLDGVPEIVFSGDFADSDALMIWSWRPPSPTGGGLVQRMRFTTKEPIRAIATCPPEEKGVPAVVAVVGAEIWLVR